MDDTTPAQQGTRNAAELPEPKRRSLHPLARYLLIRLLVSVLLVFGVTLVTFVLSHLVPADPVTAIIGERAAGDPAKVAAFRKSAGLDKPLPVQYFRYLRDLLHGDLGTSNQTGQSVAAGIGKALPASLELGLGAIVIAVLVGITLGLLAALNRDRIVDQVIRGFTLIGVSAPVFWVGAVGYFVFFYKLRLVPGSGRIDPGWEPPPKKTGLYTVDALLNGDFQTFSNAAAHLVLPSCVLALFTVGLLTRFSRSSVLEVLNFDYIRAARAKGLPGYRVVLRYVLRAALVPIITVVGLAFGSLLSGAVLTETVFSWGGIGQYAYEGATKLDLPVIMGVGLVIGVIYIIVNLVVDVIYGLIDPRVRVQ